MKRWMLLAAYEIERRIVGGGRLTERAVALIIKRNFEARTGVKRDSRRVRE